MNPSERTAWLESRRNGIGSSDVAKILGLSRWGTALQVYVSKVEPNPSEEMAPPLEWGHRLEPVISAAVMDHYGWKLDKVPTLRHKEHEFLIASLDRVNQDREICEIKSTARGEGYGERETSEIPEHVWVQCQHQLEVADLETCWVFVLIGQCDFRRYRIERDSEYMPTVFPHLREFWDRVEQRNPPEPDWSHPDTPSLVSRLCRPKPGTTIDLDGSAIFIANDYELLSLSIGELTGERDEAKARLTMMLGEFEQGNLPDGRAVVRKMQTRKAHTVKESTFPKFDIKKAKVTA